MSNNRNEHLTAPAVEQKDDAVCREIELYNRIAEAIKLGEWIDIDDMQFCVAIAKKYGCKPLETDIYNFCCFLTTLYNYGKVQGKRSERARRKRRDGTTDYLFNQCVADVMKMVFSLQKMTPEQQQKLAKDCLERAKGLGQPEFEITCKVLAVTDKYLKKE